MTLHGQKYPLIILYAISLHLIWAACALADPSAMNGTALHGIYALFTGATPYVCIAAALMAMAALLMQSTAGYTMLMPQQFLLFLSAFSAITAVLTGHFADGIERSQGFILSDQVPAILGCAAHTIAMCQLIRK